MLQISQLADSLSWQALLEGVGDVPDPRIPQQSLSRQAKLAGTDTHAEVLITMLSTSVKASTQIMRDARN